MSESNTAIQKVIVLLDEMSTRVSELRRAIFNLECMDDKDAEDLQTIMDFIDSDKSQLNSMWMDAYYIKKNGAI